MELNSLRDEENMLRLQVGAAQQLVDVLTAQKQHKQELQTRRVEMAQQITRLEKLERAFGKNGVPALLIEQTLPDIEGKANQILDRLSAGSMSLKIETQRERKTKKDESAIQTLDLTFEGPQQRLTRSRPRDSADGDYRTFVAGPLIHGEGRPQEAPRWTSHAPEFDRRSRS